MIQNHASDFDRDERPTLSTLVDYCVQLHRANTNTLGFIPRPRLEQYAHAGQILLETENGDPCGFLVYGAGYPTLRVYQACIQYDARRRRHGFNLVKRLIQVGIARNAEGIALRCADGLEANDFWAAAGFIHVATTAGGKRRNRNIRAWYMPLWPVLIPPQPLLPG